MAMTAEHKAKMKSGREAHMQELREFKAFKAAKAAQAQPDMPVKQPEVQEVNETPEIPAEINRNRTPNRSGRMEAIGRSGEVLSRQRTQSGDIFAVPADLIPQGWEYQWCAVSVTGNSEILLDQNLMFAENGWRAVPASRYPGRFMPVGHKGSIIRGSQMLMERPKTLSDEARAEDVRAARQLISDRNESLKLTKVRGDLGAGYEMSDKYRGTGGGIRMQIDKSLDVQRQDIKPQYETE